LKVEKKVQNFFGKEKRKSDLCNPKQGDEEEGDKLTSGVNTLLESDLSKSSLTEW